MWLFIACFREIHKALQDCRALYPRLELSGASAGGAHVLKVRFFFLFQFTIILSCLFVICQFFFSIKLWEVY